MLKKLSAKISLLMAIALLLVPFSVFAQPAKTSDIGYTMTKANGQIFRGQTFDFSGKNDMSTTFYYSGSSKSLLDFNIQSVGDTDIHYTIISPDRNRIISGGPIKPRDNESTLDIKLPGTGTYEIYIYNDHRCVGNNGAVRIWAYAH